LEEAETHVGHGVELDAVLEALEEAVADVFHDSGWVLGVVDRHSGGLFFRKDFVGQS
jgi:hypothetical protein